MQLMEFHLLIEQSQNGEENGSTLSLTAKKLISSLRKNRIQTGEGPPSIPRSDIGSHNKSKKKTHM